MNAPLRSKTVLITGGTAGIGRETARGLARLGAHVIVVGRDPDRARATAAELTRDAHRTDGARTGHPPTGRRPHNAAARATALTADVSSSADLRRLAEEVARRHDRIDVLINNAGGMNSHRRLTADGVEATFAVNVLAPYTLTGLLLPLLTAAAEHGGARVVNLTGGMPDGPIDPDNLQGEKTYLGWTFSQYNHAKTALMAMSLQAARRLQGTAITVNVAYPGHAHTPGNRALAMRAFPYAYRPAVPLLRLLGPLLLADLAKAARSSVHLASSPDLENVTGTYVNAKAQYAHWPASVLDQHNRDAVWTLCERLSRLTIP
ncbi:SDR family NAD(P)-dependent oxidoreductase [Actinomadura rugatobispora]|uniref:SDR family NAD(P)-dependent oxidoreductase n=1 Tax=Actinomadura rugatobispora TaxID=1994 RepID=A0ABW0ZST5_9ACTN|nr:SDR family oxidoreductase [Actinomadura rugatobispora]